MTIEPNINFNELILITNNTISKKLTLNLLNMWKNSNSNSILKVVDLNDFTISNCIKDTPIKIEKNKKKIDDMIEDYDITTYPSILVFRNKSIIEYIYGNYQNILDIVNFYL